VAASQVFARSPSHHVVYPGPYSPESLEDQSIAATIVKFKTSFPRLQLSTTKSSRVGREVKRQCTDPRSASTVWAPGSMSQPSPASRPASDPRDGTIQRDSTAQAGLAEAVPREMTAKLAEEGRYTEARLAPILPQPTSRDPSLSNLNVLRQRPSRPVDVHTMLNPSTEHEDGQRRRRSAAHFDSPQPSEAELSQRTAAPYQQSAASRISPKTREDSQMNAPQLPVAMQPSRRILTPKSPTQRLASAGMSSIGAALAPGLPADPGRGPHQEPEQQRSISTSASMTRQFSAASTSLYIPSTMPPRSRRSSRGMTTQAPSQSVSPSASYSSLSQQSQASPALGYPSLVPQQPSIPYQPAQFTASYHQGTGQPTHLSSDVQYGLPSSTTAQSNYQMMTINTDQGPIQVPVDIQAASKVADDKRKRNAGASARFRQRRKEKEREASQTIAKLEQQARDLADHRDFYRAERDHFRQMVTTKLGPAYTDGRPLSPLQRRQPSYSGSTQSTPWPVPHPPMGSDRPVGRSSSAYVPGQALPPINTGVVHVQSTRPYTPSPTQAFESRSVLNANSQRPTPTSAGSKPDPYDPYAPERYERGWPSSREQN
jgi:hypothetical protein